MTPIPRRHFLRTTGLLGAGALALPHLGSTARASARPPLAGLAVEAEAHGLFASTCTLTASDVQGPFYQDLNLIRQDITEGEVGQSLGLAIQVLDANTCSPILGAFCDVWHTNAPGNYSGFASEGTAGQTWLRGIQMTDVNGVATFETIYPGWYPGRATHIHLKVRPNSTSELTTQLYFPDPTSAYVYGLPPYDQDGPNPVSNAQDAFFSPDRRMRIRRRQDGTMLAAFRLAVQ